MNNQINFLGKIFILSLVLSLTIKYVAPLVFIPPTNLNAFTLVMILPLITTLLLGWKFLNKSSNY